MPSGSLRKPQNVALHKPFPLSGQKVANRSQGATRFCGLHILELYASTVKLCQNRWFRSVANPPCGLCFCGWGICNGMDGHPFLLSLRCTSWPSFGPNLGLEPWRIRVKVSAPCALPCGGIFARTCESFRCCRVVAFHFRIEIISESEFCTSSLIYRYQCTCTGSGAAWLCFPKGNRSTVSLLTGFQYEQRWCSTSMGWTTKRMA